MPTASEKPRVSIVKVLVLLFSLPVMALGGFIAATGFLTDGTKDLREHTPIPKTVVDLSKPGTVSVPVDHKHSTPFGVVLTVRTDRPIQTQAQLDEMLAGLAGNIIVNDASGAVWETVDFPYIEYPLEESEIGFAQIVRSTPKGAYTARITINEGAPAMSGVEHSIVSYNSVGYFPMMFEAVGRFGLMVLIVGLLPFLCILPGLLKDGMRVRRVLAVA